MECVALTKHCDKDSGFVVHAKMNAAVSTIRT